MRVYSRVVEYDVAISFAGEDRETAQALADLLASEDLKVFFDDFERADLWGKNLYEHLHAVYSTSSRYCLILVSNDYVRKRWTRHEWRAAQERALDEVDDYVLPVLVDDAILPGLPKTIGFLDLRETSLAEVAALTISKVADHASHRKVVDRADSHFQNGHLDRCLNELREVELSTDPRALVLQASALQEMGDYKGAVEALETAKPLNPFDFLVNFMLGVNYFRIGKFDESVDHYEAAEKIKPGHPTIAVDLPAARRMATGQTWETPG